MRLQYSIVVLLIAFLTISYLLGYTPLAVPLIFIAVSSLTYIVYAKDKKSAQAGSQRSPENTLHLLSLACGWPGAVLAQQRLRHKTKKVSFRITFWLTVVLNTGALIGLHSEHGNRLLRNGFFHIENAAITHVHSEYGLSTVLFFTTYRAKIKLLTSKSTSHAGPS